MERNLQIDKTKSDTKYVLYARRSVEKSDREEKVASIESQLLEMQRLAVSQGLKIVKTFQEAKSAKSPYKREQFQKMIELIQRGGADGILCWKMDRLARNPIDEGSIKYLLQTGIVKNIKASDRDWYPDDNVLMASVEFGVATQYSRDLAKHIKRGMKARCEAGVRPCYATVGYKNSKYHEKGKEEILVDEERFPLVRQLFDLMLTGSYSRFELTRLANDRLGLTVRTILNKQRKISKSNLYNIFTNPFYYGEFEYPEKSGNWYKGIHRPMITKEEYGMVQLLLGQEGRPRSRVHTCAYTGLIKCSLCGASITADEKIKRQKNGNVHRYVYYFCTGRANSGCTQASLNEKEIDRQILEILDRITIPKSFHNWAVETLQEMHEQEKVDSKSVLYSQKRQLEDVTKKLNALLDMRLAGELTSELYQEKKLEFESDQLRLQTIVSTSESRSSQWLEDIRNAFDFAQKAKKEFTEADPEKKRRILSALGQNRILNNGILELEVQKPLLYIQKALETKNCN